MLFGTLRNGSRTIVAIFRQPSLQQRAGLSGKASRPNYQRPKPWPYMEKQYGVLQAFFDKTTWRFDENSKIVVVEGPIASGKTEFAKALADELDMKYLPAVNMDHKYINSYGVDLRSYNDELPENLKCFDEKDFLLNPHHRTVASFQITMCRLKYSQYIDAVCHLLNTGQGVVIERSCFSDQVFLEAMYEAGYISKEARKFYYKIRSESIELLLKPHLVIYLDVPVSKVEENIKKRSLQHEVKSKVLTTQYLTAIDKQYKGNHLNKISEHAELLVYDWSEGGDVEVVVEDIERIDFDRFERHDKKLKDWRYWKEWDICEERIWYTKLKYKLLGYFDYVIDLDVPEVFVSGQDIHDGNKVLAKVPGNQFTPGFNEHMGDKNVLFKSKVPLRQDSPWL